MHSRFLPDPLIHIAPYHRPSFLVALVVFVLARFTRHGLGFITIRLVLVRFARGFVSRILLPHRPGPRLVFPVVGGCVLYCLPYVSKDIFAHCVHGSVLACVMYDFQSVRHKPLRTHFSYFSLTEADSIMFCEGFIASLHRDNSVSNTHKV